MKGFKEAVSKARSQLETLSLDASEDVTLFVTEIQEMKRQVSGWQAELDRYKSGNRLLVAQRYQFPNEWINIDLVEGEWTAFRQILKRKSDVMDEQIPTLQKKILDEERAVEGRIAEIEKDWKENRPHQSNYTPKEALDLLAIIGKKITATKQEWVRICKAKELLEMELGRPERLDYLEEDLQGLRAVWTQLNKVSISTIEVINETPFSAFVYKKVKELLDNAIQTMKDFDNRLRQYPLYDEYMKKIENYKKANTVLGELKSDAMKPRHWNTLRQKLHIKSGFNELTFSHFWTADILKHQNEVNEILTQARGELILEEFLRNIKETWAKYELELAARQGKCKLIRGWDDLFQ